MFSISTLLRAIVVLCSLALFPGCVSTTSTPGNKSLGANANASGASKAAENSAVDVAAIQKLYAEWRVAVESADIPSYLSVLHPQVRLFPPGAAPILGSAGYGDFLGPVFASATYRIDIVKLQEVQVMGDIAIAEYEYIINIELKDSGSAITQPGALTAARNHARYFDVLRKQADGRWGIWRHLWQDMPLEAN